MALVFSVFCKKRIESQTREWVPIDASSSTGGHLVTKFGNLITLVNSQGDTKGIALYRENGLLEKKHFSPGRNVTFSQMVDYQLSANEMETDYSLWIPHKFTTYTGVFDGSRKYIIAFHFVCDDFIYFLAVFIIISAFTLLVNIALDKDLQIQLREMLLSSFLGTIHDLDSFLTLAYNYAIMVKDEILKGNIKNRSIIELNNTFLKTSPLVNVMKKDLLDIMKDEVNKELKNISLSEVYRDYKEFTISAQDHVELIENINSHHQIQADYNGILSIIANLMSNGFKFASGCFKIVNVSTWDSDCRSYFSVASTGPEFNKIQKKKIFEAFHRLTKINGSGLGLWIVDRHVTSNNGQITVESKEGFNFFTVSFPIIDKNLDNTSRLNINKRVGAPCIKKNKLTFQKGSECRILVLDDQKHVVHFVENKLVDLDCSIEYFPSTKMLLESLASGYMLDHSIILLDRYIEGGNDILKTNFPSRVREEFGYNGLLCLFTTAVPDPLPKEFDAAIHKQDDFSSVIDIT